MMVILILVSYVEVNLKENFLSVKIRSMKETLPLKQVFILIKLARVLLSENSIRAESVGTIILN